MSERLFNRSYEISAEMLLDFVQQVMASLPNVTAYELDSSGDRINFTTSFTLTSWGENMVASAESDGPDGSILTVSGTPRVGALSTAWGEEIHAAAIEAQLFSALEPSIEMARTNPVVMLQADHRRVEALFARIGSRADEERAELVRQLASALRVHMELEETLVYPLLAAQVDKDLAEEAEVEHQLARDGLAQLQELTPDEPGFDAALVMVMAGIEHHVQEEEGEAFPGLVSRLSAEQLAELAGQLTSRRAELVRREASPTPETRPPRPKRPSNRQGPRNKRKSAKINPDESTKADLIERAKKAGVSGYSHMSKADLAKAIARAQ
jgi:hemerythrin-like domain-containing protein